MSRSANSLAPPGIGTGRGTLSLFPEKLYMNCSIRRGGVRETRRDPPVGLDERDGLPLSMETTHAG